MPFHPGLILLSLAIAAVAAYAAVDFASRAQAPGALPGAVWLAGGGLIMGVGMWAMHAVGNLAGHFPLTDDIDLGLVAASLFFGAAGAAVALRLLLAGARKRRLAAAAFALSLGVVAMHRLGMRGFHLRPTAAHGVMTGLLPLAVCFLFSAAGFALLFPGADGSAAPSKRKAAGSLLAGAAICGTHCTDLLLSAYRPSYPGLPVPHAHFLAPAVVVAGMALMIFGFAFLSAWFDRRAGDYARRLTLGLTEANARLEQAVAERTRELQRQVDERRRRETQLSDLFAQDAVGILYATADGRVLRANRAYRELTGYTAAELETDSVLSFTHADDRQESQTQLRQLFAGEIPRFSMEKRYQRKNGGTVWVSVTATLGRTPSDDGQPICIALVEDITARKAVEAELRESRGRLALAFDAAEMSGWEIDAATGTGWYAGHILRLFGGSGEPVRASREEVLRVVHPDDRLSVAAVLFTPGPAGASRRVEYRVRLPDGGERWLASYCRVVSDGAGVRVYGVSQDVTRRRFAEQAMRDLAVYQQEAREAERMRIAREIHDDLGGTLTAMKLHVSRWARADAAGPRAVEEVMALVDQSVEALRRIMNDLRPSVLDEVGLWAALEWLARDFERKMGIACSYDLDGEEIDVDPPMATAVFRIVQEALTNVARHAAATSAHVQASTTGGEIVVEVSDNGRGVTESQMDACRSFGLRGIGERARAFNGAVTVEGRPGSGTRVLLHMPLTRNPQPA